MPCKAIHLLPRLVLLVGSAGSGSFRIWTGYRAAFGCLMKEATLVLATRVLTS